MIRLGSILNSFSSHQRSVVHSTFAHAPLFLGDKPAFQLLPCEISSVIVVEVVVYRAMVAGHIEHQDRGEECVST